MYKRFRDHRPDSDPPGIRGKSVSEALTAVKNAAAIFVSRGDNSGTNKKELLLWKNAVCPFP